MVKNVSELNRVLDGLSAFITEATKQGVGLLHMTEVPQHLRCKGLDVGVVAAAECLPCHV